MLGYVYELICIPRVGMVQFDTRMFKLAPHTGAVTHSSLMLLKWVLQL